MRTIKFRGKRVDNGEWVYGSFVQTETQSFILEGVDLLDMHEVHPETVGQFIRRDSDGNDVYDGDQIEIIGQFGEPDKPFEHDVVWNNDESCYELEVNGEVCCGFPMNRNFYVIGNIHDESEER